MTGVGSPRGLEGFLLEQGKRLTAQERRQTPSFSSVLRSIETLAGGSVGENLVPNPSFERGLTDWDPSGEDFSEIDTNFFRAGQSSLSSESDLRRVSQPFAVQPGDTVRLTGYAAFTGPTTAALAGILDREWDSAHWAVSIDLASTPADGMWHRFSVDYIVPTGTTVLWVRLATVMANKDAGEAAWFDDISVRVLTDSPATSSGGRLSGGERVNTGVAGNGWVADANGIFENGWYWGSASSKNTPTSDPHMLEVRSVGGSNSGVYQEVHRLKTSARLPARWSRYSTDGGATWTSWTLAYIPLGPFSPRVNNGLTIGNGTLSGEYAVADGQVSGTIFFRFGSTSAVTGDVTFVPPRELVSGMLFKYGRGRANIAGGGLYDLVTLVANGNLYARALSVTSTYVRQVSLNSSTPTAWTTGSSIEIDFLYSV